MGALFVTLIVVTRVVGSDPDPEFTRLETALDMVPETVANPPVAGIPFTSQPIEFANFSGSREAAGLGQVVGIQAYLSLPQDDRRSLYQGLPKPPGGIRDHEAELYEKMAIDLYGFDLGVWVNQPKLDFRNFMVLQGAYDKEEIRSKLLGLGYKEAQHKEVKYYWLFEDPKVFEETKVPLSYPLVVMAPHLNRVAFMDDKLLLGSDDVVIRSLIDVQLGDLRSVRNNSGYVRLPRASGLGVLGGVLLDYRWLRETWRRYPERYVEVPVPWGSLESYALVLLGYRQTGETVVALYSGVSSADHNAGELEQRWNTYYAPSWDADLVTTGARDGTTRPGAYQGGPVTNFCSDFSTSVFERKGKGPLGPWEYAVLTGTCQIVDGEGSEVATRGPELWRILYETEQLSFLVRFDDL